MAFRVEAIQAMGGFDPYLGAGTRTHGGEETKLFASCSGQAKQFSLAQGNHLAFSQTRNGRTPQAVLWVQCRLVPFYISMIRSEPFVLLEMHKLLPLVYEILDCGVAVSLQSLPATSQEPLTRQPNGAPHRGRKLRV